MNKSQDSGKNKENKQPKRSTGNCVTITAFKPIDTNSPNGGGCSNQKPRSQSTTMASQTQAMLAGNCEILTPPGHGKSLELMTSSMAGAFQAIVGDEPMNDEEKRNARAAWLKFFSSLNRDVLSLPTSQQRAYKSQILQLITNGLDN